MIQRSGFSLFECLIYLSLISGITLLIGTVASSFFIAHSKLLRAADVTMQLYLVELYMARDIQQAPAELSRWRHDTEEISWQGKQRHGWKLRDKKIIRTAGEEVSGVADGIDACTFELDRQGNFVRGVQVSVSKQGVASTRYIGVYERTLGCSSSQ